MTNAQMRGWKAQSKGLGKGGDAKNQHAGSGKTQKGGKAAGKGQNGGKAQEGSGKGQRE